MKKYLMTGLAAITLSSMLTGCSNDLAETSTPEFSVLDAYEKAFEARFGTPAANQTWGFSDGSVAGTRAVVASPSVTEVGYTFNAQMANAWQGVAAAIASGTSENYFTFMDSYASWKDSGWKDKFYQINATVVPSTLTDEYRAKVTEAILEEIPEGGANLSKATSTGYTITTTGGPVTLTPIYHNSNSGDLISYYYYPAGSTPNIKTLPKYTVGNMADPNVCNDQHTSLYKNTYNLVYVDDNGNVSYNFPAGYVINFMVSNTWTGNGTLKIYKEGGITETTTGGSTDNLEVKGKYAISAGEHILSGTSGWISNGMGEVKIGNDKTGTAFKAVKQGTEFEYNGTTFKYYTEGNGWDGSMDGGNTCYYIIPHYIGKLTVGVALGAGKTLKVKKLGENSVEWNDQFTEYYSYTNNNNSTYHGTISIDVDETYIPLAFYAEGSKLGFYGMEFHDDNAQHNMAFTSNDVGTSFALGSDRDGVCQVIFGRKNTYFKAATANGNVDGYTAYTAGTSANGSLSGGATTYYFKTYDAGYIRAAVVLNEGKTMRVVDLGSDNWSGDSGTAIASFTASEKYYGTYDFPVEGGHVYAVYAEGSKLGFYGCEFLQGSGSTQSSTSVSNVVKTSIANSPEYYGNGAYNTAIHSSGLSQWSVSAATTPHVAVFSINDKNYVGFEDWTDLDFNDVIFEVTGTEGGEEIEIDEEEEKKDDPTPTNAVCRIIAEDLTVGENSDFDFNDVVFDVIPNSDGATTTIRLRAAGGTLPLYIAGHEVHAAFGVSQGTMVNTGWDGKGIDYTDKYVDFTISGYYNSRAAANGIPVTVTKRGTTSELVNIELTAREGKIASKVCVGTDFQWCDERTDIDDRFKKSDGTKLFTGYVKGQFGDDWYTYKGK